MAVNFAIPTDRAECAFQEDPLKEITLEELG
jgi:hypothetical protein